MSENIKVKLNKKQKKAIIIIAMILVVIAGLFACFKANQTAIYSKAMYALMPKSVVGEIDGKEIECFVEMNKDFDTSLPLTEITKAFTYYYVDADGNVVDLGVDATVNQDGEDVQVFLAFMPQTIENFENAKDTAVKIIIPVIVILVVVLIVVWFFKWSKKQDLEKQKKYGNKNNQKKKNKK